MSTASTGNAGGYEMGYRACGCFWGREPGSLVRLLVHGVGLPIGAKVLDAGCGEGKNAAFLSDFGASVRAIDLSQTAIVNAKRTWGDLAAVEWQIADVRELAIEPFAFDVVVAYGLLHCLCSESEIAATVARLQVATKPDGIHVVCAFNDRAQDLRAHPGFQPTLARHLFYCNLYAEWELLHVSDSDLFEIHPHNGIPHSHSMTRILARKRKIHDLP